MGVRAPFLFLSPRTTPPPLTLFVSLGSGDDVFGRGEEVAEAGGVGGEEEVCIGVGNALSKVDDLPDSRPFRR